jgi:cytochrome P450
VRGPLRALVGDADEIARDSLTAYARFAREQGDVARVQFLRWPLYLVFHPDGVAHVLQVKHQGFSKDLYTYNLLKVVAGNGLLTNDGPGWLRQRRLLQPAFHRERVEAFARIAEEETDRLLERWIGSSGRGHVDVAPDLFELTLAVALKALFGVQDEAELAGEAPTFGEVLALVTDYVHMPLPPLWVPTRRNLRLRTSIARLNRLVRTIVERRRRSGAGGEDLLAALVAARDAGSGEPMSDDQVRDEVMTLLFAGHETTAVTLMWALHLLATHPDTQEKAREEVGSVYAGGAPDGDAAGRLPFIRMVVEETLRLYPAAWSFGRKALHDETIGDVRIPAGSLVWVSPWVTHRDARFWDGPDSFRPERFAPESSAGRPKFAYFPFGSGPRMCIGSQFAMAEMCHFLASAVRQFEFEPVPGFAPEPEALLSLRSRNGLRLGVRSRKPQATSPK